MCRCVCLAVHTNKGGLDDFVVYAVCRYVFVYSSLGQGCVDALCLSIYTNKGGYMFSVCPSVGTRCVYSACTVHHCIDVFCLCQQGVCEL